jgi:hypothetical protein
MYILKASYFCHIFEVTISNLRQSALISVEVILFVSVQKVICGFLQKARGPQQIAEVVDDMVDAVIGDEPRVSHSAGTTQMYH